MANLNRPDGLSPVDHLQAQAWSGKLNLYYIPSTDSNAYSIGDPVATLTGAANALGVSPVTLATAGASGVLRGVIVTAGGDASQVADAYSNYADPANLGTTVIPASKPKNYYVGVVDDPYVIFEIQEWGGASFTAFTAADVGKGCNLKSGTNSGYVSGWTLDTTAASSTASTRQVRLLGLVARRNNAFGQYARWRVLINQHELKAATSGV